MTTHEQDTFTQSDVENSREARDPATDRANELDTDYAEPATGAAQPLPDEAPDRQVQQDWSDGAGLSPDQPEPVRAHSDAAHSDAAVVSSEQTTSAPVADSTESSAGRALFADDELAGLSARWDSVQAAFVDDPRECVQKADGLVSDVVKQLTSSFSDARSRLEEQWSRGEEASTEDLRVALKQYREFFQRLLAV
jgi:hypothetical protein